MTKRLVIIQLYPDQMNIYGDTGNAQIICQRVRLYGYEPQLLAYNSKADLNNLLKADLVVGWRRTRFGAAGHTCRFG